MVLYRTAIVQGLSSAHGREERRLFCPVFWVFISTRLKDTDLVRMVPDAGYGQGPDGADAAPGSGGPDAP